MATRTRRSTGGVVVRGKPGDRTYAIRFRALGRRRQITLGTTAEGWTHKKAEDELENVLADVRRGMWRPPEQDVDVEPEEATSEKDFATFAEQWYERGRLQWAGRTPGGR